MTCSSPVGRTFRLCSVEYARMLEVIRDKIAPLHLPFGETPGYRVCFRPGMIDDEVLIRLDSGEEINITHVEHA